MIAAIFDLDGTLYTGHIGRGITRHHRTHRVKREAATAFAWIAEHYVQPLVRPDLMERVWSHLGAGHRVILVSGTPAPLLAEIGRQLGIVETVGTPLVLRSGRYTGACELPVCQGPGKVLRLEAHLEGDSIVRSHSYAYADSHTDLPLLEWVGHAVAVYPDDELVTHAQSQGWEIISMV